MSEKYSVLIVEDHPLIVEAYKSALAFISTENKNLEFIVESANDCELGSCKALKIIERKRLDLIFLDIKLPPSHDGKIISGEDLGIRIRKLSPASRIIIATSFNDNFRIYSIIKSIDPDGFLVKDDISSEELVYSIKRVIKNPPYYSRTVSHLLRKQFSSDFLLDDIDRKLLYELSLGTRLKDLPDVLPLSIAGIEKRRRRLKEIFGTKTSSDRELILKAKEKGFI